MRNVILTLIITTDAPIESFTDKTLSLTINDGRGSFTPTIVNATAIEDKAKGLGPALTGPQKAVSESIFSNMAMNMKMNM